MTLIFKYDELGRFVAADTADRGIDGELLVPNRATLERPPTGIPFGSVAVYVDGWEVMLDNVGRTYWLPDGTEVEVTEVGIPVPEDALDQPLPPTKEQIRDSSAVDKGAFCLALFAAGMLPADEVREASKGNWPASFATALEPLTEEQELAAQVEWATAQTVRRNHPTIALLQGFAGLSDGQVDGLFGIE